MYAWGINFRDFNFFFFYFTCFAAERVHVAPHVVLARVKLPDGQQVGFSQLFILSPNTLFDTSCCGENIVVI